MPRALGKLSFGLQRLFLHVMSLKNAKSPPASLPPFNDGHNRA